MSLPGGSQLPPASPQGMARMNGSNGTKVLAYLWRSEDFL